MAAKKKSTRKKAAKKRVTKKKATKKRSSSKPKKSPKRKSTRKARTASKAKKSSRQDKISAKKVGGKKKASKKTKPFGFDIPKGPTIETAEAPTVAIESMSINALFKLGLGQIKTVLIRSGKELETKSLTQTGQIMFDDVRARDVIAISGVTSGTAEIITNRLTKPASDSANPRKFKEQQILDLLKIL